MDSINYENQILNAIETIVNNTVENAGYDKTIKARILERTNPNIGEYKVRYQDSTFYAYATDVELRYVKDTLVYVLIPNNDMSQIKTIVSAVDKDNVEYVEILEEEDYFDKVGANVCGSQIEFGLCSYSGNSSIILYDKENNVNWINYDATSFELYLKNLYNIIGGAYFKTQLDAEQQKQGNYGIVFEMKFQDEIDETQSNIKQFVLDVNEMEGNPYRFNNYSRQEKIYSINSDKFQEITRIYIFSKGFPITETGHDNDIFVKMPLLYAARELPESERNGYTVQLSSEKMYFTEDDQDEDTSILDSVVKIRGRIPQEERHLQYYWFKENLDIYPTMPGYNSYGGAGWECLNEYNILEGTDENPTSIEYITNKSNWTITKADCTMLNNNYKLVVVFSEESSVENTITIKNYDAAFDFTILSDEGTEFYYGNGTPTLTAKVVRNSSEPIPANLTYKWIKIDNNDLYTALEDTTTDNNIYNTAVTNYNTLVAAIEDGTEMPAAAAQTLAGYKATIDSYDYIQRVEGNKIYKIQVNEEIDEYADYKCSFYDGDTLIGIASITLFNYPKIEGEYYLNIINGAQTFNYNAAGVAPNNQTLDNPITLKPLSFEIVDSKGNLLPDRILRYCDVQWTAPKGDCLLIAQDSTALSLEYEIEQKYDISKLHNNNIQLSVKYQDLSLFAETNFAFVKDGDPGTNGTDIVCKIVPDTEDPVENYPMIICNMDGTFRELNYTPISEGYWFKTQLWQNGTLLWEGRTRQSSAGVTGLTWSNLSTNRIDKSHIKIYSGGLCSFQNIDSSLAANQYPVDIIKVQVEYKGSIYYASLPIITCKTTNMNFDIQLLKNTGFRFAVYSSNGKNPQYDNTVPFTIRVLESIPHEEGGTITYYTEDISETNNVNYELAYTWEEQASIYYENAWHSVDTLIPEVINNNRGSFIPMYEFSGEAINTAIEVSIVQGNLSVGSIHIPIHYYLNRYGLSAINDWDGNSVQINDETGIILTPQVGAGSKNNANQFTGVLIGSVKEGAQEIAEEGLFGYHEGERSIFLDAHTGKAEFGTAGKSRIILDPSQNTGQIYSGNYSTTSGTGLMIDLTTPFINFGSGNFSVNAAGFLTAKGGGNIAGWKISDGALTKDAGNFINEEETQRRYTIGLSSDGELSGENKVFWVQDHQPIVGGHEYPFYINNNGVFYAQGMTIEGGVLDENSFIRGSLSLGPYYNVPGGDPSGYNFSVNHEGYLTITGEHNSGAYIKNATIAANSSIGPFSLSSTALYNDKPALADANDGIYLGTDGIALGASSVFKVTKAGVLTSTSGSIGGWTIGTDSLHSGLGTSYVGMSSDTSASTNITFWAGKSDSATAPFRVSRAGTLTAIDASLINPTISRGNYSYTFSNTESRINEIPKIYSGTGAPTGGQNGDIYIRYS